MSDEKKVKIQFAPEQKSPTLEIHQGEYRRLFDVKDQPFECDLEEAAWLLKEGHFIEAPADATKDASKMPATPVAGKIVAAPAGDESPKS